MSLRYRLLSVVDPTQAIAEFLRGTLRHLRFAGLVVEFTISLGFRSGCGLL